ncbi:MAG: hypothetical protein J6A88_00810 [Oscillospiraceae bacterium]|nr:hypothetical protein [Oscillospiraceae bacterium]
MKKYIALILTLVMALSLCACGNTNDEKTNEPESNPTIEESIPTEPSIPNLEMFVGAWSALKYNSVVPNDSFSINADGTMKYHGKEYTWTAEKLPESSINEMEITAADAEGNNAYTIRLKRTPDDTYVANFRKYGNVMGSGTDYYRDADYTVVELTEDNVLDYVETEVKFVFDTNSDGFTKTVEHKLYIRFKEGVGYLSVGNVNFVTKATYQDVHFEAKPGNYTLGEVKSISDNGSLNRVWLTGGSESYCYTTTWWVSKPGEAFKVAFTFNELTGVEWCDGRVFLLNK